MTTISVSLTIDCPFAVFVDKPTAQKQPILLNAIYVANKQIKVTIKIVTQASMI